MHGAIEHLSESMSGLFLLYNISESSYERQWKGRYQSQIRIMHAMVRM